MRPIDADALKSWIDCGHLSRPTELCFSEQDVVRIIDMRPTIDAVPVVHGHWIKVLGGNGLVSTIRCSECDNCDNPSYIPGNYCWFCGAKMDGGEDGEAD